TATLLNASVTNSTTNASPSTPTLVSPGNAARLNTATPTLTATFLDPDTQDTGKVTFEVCTTNNCSSSLGTFDSTSTTLAVNATVTWSENLDQTQAVPGSALSITPNGGVGIAGTGAAVSYPAANQTRFTLFSALHHLDTLALTYTKPGADPMVRDTALATGNAAATATLLTGSITNST